MNKVSLSFPLYSQLNFTCRKFFLSSKSKFSTLCQKFLSVSIIGTANSGKSSLTNSLVGTQVSAISPKVGTTRLNTLGIYTQDNIQLAFYDTPGLFLYNKTSSRYVHQTIDSITPSDTIIFIVDAAKYDKRLDLELASNLKPLKSLTKQQILVLNKVDWIFPKSQLIDISNTFNQINDFDVTFMVSAFNGDGIIDIRDFLLCSALDGPWQFDPSQSTNMDTLQQIKEIIREKLFLRLNQELPYQIEQENVEFKYLENGLIFITQRIFVKNTHHKKILLGKQGQTLNHICQMSRVDIEKYLKSQILLKIEVSVVQ